MVRKLFEKLKHITYDNGIDEVCEERENSSMVIVVKEPKDILALEKVKDFNGTYHVLHGTLNPLEGKGPNDIRIKELLTRISSENIHPSYR